MPQMPTLYRAPLGLPLRWQDERSGVLPAAVETFIDHQLGRAAITDEQAELVRAYCEYYIHAPCWATGNEEGEESPEYSSDFTALKERIKTLKTAKELAAWIKDSYGLGIDPL